MKRTYKKGSMLIELLIYLVATGAIIAGSFALINGKKDEATYKNSMDNFLQSFHEGMLKYSIDSIQANNNFANVTPTEAATFMNPSIVKLSADGTYLTATHSSLNELLKVTVSSAKDPNGNDNRRYKTMFDLSAYGDANGWNPADDKDASKYIKIETEIARFFKNITPDVLIAGEAVALGAANADATASNPNVDGIIVIDKIK